MVSFTLNLSLKLNLACIPTVVRYIPTSLSESVNILINIVYFIANVISSDSSCPEISGHAY